MRKRRARTPVARTSLFLVGLDQQPVRIARAGIAAEGPRIASLDRVAERAGDDLTVRVAGDGGDVGFEPDGDHRHPALERRLGNYRLLDRDQPVVEAEAILLALLDRARERLIDVRLDMAAERVQIAFPEGLKDHPVGGLRAFEKAGDVEA